MEPILYWYPVYYLNGEEPYGSAVVRKSGRIIPFQLKKEPYEVDVEAGGTSFHLVFGHKTNGLFLCVLDRNIGCELSELLNRDQNMNLVMDTECLGYEDTAAITWALYSLGGLLRFIH